MNKFVLALVALALSALACGQYVGTPTPQVTPEPQEVAPSPSPVPTATAAPTATAGEDVNTVTIRAVVWIRSEPDGERIGSLETGDTVEIVACGEKWCELADGGFVWRGCTSDPAELKCEAAP